MKPNHVHLLVIIISVHGFRRALKRQGPESASIIEIHDYSTVDYGQLSGNNCKLYTNWSKTLRFTKLLLCIWQLFKYELINNLWARSILPFLDIQHFYRIITSFILWTTYMRDFTLDIRYWSGWPTPCYNFIPHMSFFPRICRLMLFYTTMTKKHVVAGGVAVAVVVVVV